MPTATGPFEKDVQHACRSAFERVGVDVSNMSQIRRSMVRTGIGDLFLMHKAFGAAWFETKREGAEQRLDQEAFQAECDRCGVPYVIGGKYEALKFLESVGLWRLPPGIEMSQFATPTTVHRASERLARVAARNAKR